MSCSSPSASEEFPYEYKKVHPCLNQKREYSTFERICLCFTFPLQLLFVPLKMVVWLACVAGNALCAWAINLGTDQTKPLPARRYRLYRFSSRFWSTLVLWAFGYRIRIHNRERLDGGAKIFVFPHRSAQDVLVDNIAGSSAFVAKGYISTNPIVSASVKTSRSLAIRPGRSLTRELFERYHSDIAWPPMTLYPEGTTSARFCMLRLRTGAFRVGVRLQPVVCVYRNSYDYIEWLQKGILGTLCDCCRNNFLGTVDITYLDSVERAEGESERAFADRVGKLMAEAAGASYTPYTSADADFFYGKAENMDRCSEQYKTDFGWMGNAAHYRTLCKKAGKRCDRQWTQKELGLE